ncbi:uncharacterized protein LOC119167429 isoform X2 [Rhipicephalus microplus]|uniref:uncharacterized protein LOC119167429 isoform X2 n=1 Tax=Rhipicephalus microplus TaxID=6941 RepID=UPI003F6CF1B6
MSHKFGFFAIFVTVIWLAMLVGKSTCPKGKRPAKRPGHGRPRAPGGSPGPSRTEPQDVIVISDSPSPPPLSPVAGPSWAGSPPGPQGYSNIPQPRPLSPVPGPSGSGSILERLRLTPPSDPIPLSSVVFGSPLLPSPSSPNPGPSGHHPRFSPTPGPSGPGQAAGSMGQPATPLHSEGLATRLRQPGSPQHASPPSSPLSPQGSPQRVPPGASSPEPTTSGTPPRGSVHPTLHALMPRHGHPGSDKSPGTIIPGPTQLWLASAFYKYMIPRERLRLKDQMCSRRTICAEGTCCVEINLRPGLCKPLGVRGDQCSPRTLSNVYYNFCPCNVNQGTCENGICT